MPFSFFLSQCWTIWYKMSYSSTFLTFIFPSFSFQCFHDCVISFAHLIILNRFPFDCLFLHSFHHHYYHFHHLVILILFAILNSISYYFVPLIYLFSDIHYYSIYLFC